MSDDIIELSPPERVAMADEWFEIASVDHFWMEWRFQVIRKYASALVSDPRRVLEIGCGSGVVLQQLAQSLGHAADGCDLNTYALNRIKGVGGHKYVYNIFDLNPTMVNQYDTVLLLDVVEHIDDHVAFLKAAAQHAKPGGHLIVNVPALNTLFSRYDTQAGHQRRYTKYSLSRLCAQAGLEAVDLQYWGASLLPLAALRKLVLTFVPREEIIETGFKPPAPWVNRLMTWIMKQETGWLSSPWRGTSLLLIARRRPA